MSTTRQFTPAEVRLIENLIEDGCPPREIARTIGCGPKLIRRHWPHSRLFGDRLDEFLKLSASIHKMGGYAS